MKLSVIGLGKLGLCTAACFARAGFNVTGVDINKEHIAKIENEILPFKENGLESLLKETKE